MATVKTQIQQTLKNLRVSPSVSSTDQDLNKLKGYIQSASDPILEYTRSLTLYLKRGTSDSELLIYCIRYFDRVTFDAFDEGGLNFQPSETIKLKEFNIKNQIKNCTISNISSDAFTIENLASDCALSDIASQTLEITPIKATDITIQNIEVRSLLIKDQATYAEKTEVLISSSRIMLLNIFLLRRMSSLKIMDVTSPVTKIEPIMFLNLKKKLGKVLKGGFKNENREDLYIQYIKEATPLFESTYLDLEHTFLNSCEISLSLIKIKAAIKKNIKNYELDNSIFCFDCKVLILEKIIIKESIWYSKQLTTQNPYTNNSNLTGDQYKLEIKNSDSLKITDSVLSPLIKLHITSNIDAKIEGSIIIESVTLSSMKCLLNSSKFNSLELIPELNNSYELLDLTLNSYAVRNNNDDKNFLKTSIKHHSTTFTYAPDLTSFTPSPNFHFFNCSFKDFSSDSINKYRDLKDKLSKLQNDTGEILFASLEMRAENKQLKFRSSAWFEKSISYLAFAFNKYGLSIVQPILVWIILLIVFSFIYYQLDLYHCSGLMCYKEPKPSWYYQISMNGKFAKSLYFSFYKSMGPLQLLTKNVPIACDSITCTAWSTLHSILSSISLYLIVAGIKKRFRQH